MKRKQNKYIVGGLIVVVAFVWGSVIFHVKNLRNPDVVSYKVNTLPFVEKSEYDAVLKDTLYLCYDDPFLKKRKLKTIQPIVESISQNDKGRIKSQRQSLNNDSLLNNKMIELEKVLYYGCIWNDKLKDKVGFVEFKKKFFVIREGDIVNNVLVKEINDMQIVVEHNSKELIIKSLNQNKGGA